jgi:hypothetical protein
MLIRIVLAALIAAALVAKRQEETRHWMYRPCDLTRQVCEIG